MTAEATVALEPTNTEAERNHKRQLAILKATGMDRLPAEQRELTLAISRKYELDLMLRHLVTIDGKPYITRDGLLHVAHRSGQLDGIETTDPVLVDGFWRSTCSVFRKDMSHAFTYTGRYPEAGKNKAFAPEMATKVGEVMSLRRAFDVSAPTAEERWDVEVPAAEPEKPKTLAERVAEKAEAVQQADEQTERPVEVESASELPIPESAPEFVDGVPSPEMRTVIGGYPTGEPAGTGVHMCESPSPFSDALCRKESGHRGAHRASGTETW